MSPAKINNVPFHKLALSYSSVLALPFLNSAIVREKVLAPQIKNSKRISAAITAYEARFSDISQIDSIEQPVFIFSAGWGSGSTLLQRLLISSEQLIVWGEPLDEAAPIHRLAETIAAVREDWPPSDHFRTARTPDELSGEWIANFSPNMAAYKRAHQQFFIEWLSASDHFSRWGLKEVRLTIDHAIYLKWLFPKAKFLFIYRDIYDSYLSVRRRPWTSVWPDYPATEIVSFAHHWHYLLKGFVENADQVDGMLIKFEDLVEGNVETNEIASYLELEYLDKNVLKKKVGSRSARRKPLHIIEKLIIDRIAGDLRAELDYR